MSHKIGTVVICEVGTGHSGEMGIVEGKVGWGKYAVRILETGQMIYTGAIKKYRGPKAWVNHAQGITPNRYDGPNGPRRYTA